MNINFSKRRLLHLVPRILGIFFIFFVGIFAFDAFEQGTLPEKIVAFLIHLIPSYLLIITYLVARKWEIIGGVAYIFLGLLYIAVFRNQEIIAYVILSGSMFFVGLLFILGGLQKEKTKA